MSNIIHLNEPELKNQLGELVRETVEETLNKLLDAEADKITNACRYERSSERLDTRAGHYTRKLMTKAGEVVYFGQTDNRYRSKLTGHVGPN